MPLARYNEDPPEEGDRPAWFSQERKAAVRPVAKLVSRLYDELYAAEAYLEPPWALGQVYHAARCRLQDAMAQAGVTLMELEMWLHRCNWYQCEAQYGWGDPDFPPAQSDEQALVEELFYR